MAKVTRPHPRRPPWLYPEGTNLTVGERRFEVSRDDIEYEVDLSYGHGGYPETVHGKSKRYWREIKDNNEDR